MDADNQCLFVRLGHECLTPLNEEAADDSDEDTSYMDIDAAARALVPPADFTVRLTHTRWPDTADMDTHDYDLTCASLSFDRAFFLAMYADTCTVHVHRHGPGPGTAPPLDKFIVPIILAPDASLAVTLRYLNATFQSDRLLLDFMRYPPAALPPGTQSPLVFQQSPLNTVSFLAAAGVAKSCFLLLSCSYAINSKHPMQHTSMSSALQYPKLWHTNWAFLKHWSRSTSGRHVCTK